MALATNTQFIRSCFKKLSVLFAQVKFSSSGVPTLEQWVPSTGSNLGSYTPASTSPVNNISTVGFQGIASVATTVNTGELLFTVMGSAQRLIYADVMFTGTNGALPTVAGAKLLAADATAPSAMLGASSNVIDVFVCVGTTQVQPTSTSGFFAFYLDDSATV